MKKYFFLTLILLLALPIAAQDPQHPDRSKKKRPEITELVNDLSVQQKRKIETITRDSKERTEALRRQQRAVRDSIRSYMDLEGDQTQALYPLFEREAELQAAVSREMYATKLRIDEVLNSEQRANLRAANKARKH